MKLTIMIDIDGVLNTLDTTVIDVYNEDSGDNLSPQDVTEYHAIDDGLFNLIGDRTYWSICFDKPYNQTDKPIPMFTRAYNWQDIFDNIKMIETLLKEDDNE